MKKLTVIALAFFLIFLSASAFAAAPLVTITGKLIDRQCSIEDVFQLQPTTEKRCTLWVEVSFSCPCTSCDGGSTTCKEVYTVYCPRKAADNRLLNTAYDVCSDGSAMQIRHPSATYTITGWLRTVDQQKDGLGQVQGFAFSY